MNETLLYMKTILEDEGVEIASLLVQELFFTKWYTIRSQLIKETNLGERTTIGLSYIKSRKTIEMWYRVRGTPRDINIASIQDKDLTNDNILNGFITLVKSFDENLSPKR